jgi:hypothetical protein
MKPNHFLRSLLCLTLGLALSGCGTTGKAIKPDASGYLPTATNGQAARATTLESTPLPSADYKRTALVTSDEFVVEQIRNLGYFGEVIDLQELQRRIVAQNLQDKVPSLNDQIGINNAARFYGAFLWIHATRKKHDDKNYLQLMATDPLTLKNLFVAEHDLVAQPYTGYDQVIFYPLFNSLIDWLKSDSAHK